MTAPLRQTGPLSIAALLLVLALPAAGQAPDSAPAPDASAEASLQQLRSLAVNDPSAAIATGRVLLDGAALAGRADTEREVLYLLGNASHRIADEAVMAEMALRLEGLGEAHDDALARAYAGFLRAERLFQQGEPQQGLAESMRAATLIQDSDAARVRAIVAFELCDDFTMAADPRSAVAYCERSTAAWRALADPFELGRALNLEAHARYALRDLARAAQLFAEARALFAARGDRGYASSIGDNLAQVYIDLGRASEALALSREALAAETRSGRIDHALRSRLNIARALARMGRLDEARDEIAATISEARAHAWKTDLVDLLRTQVEVARARGDLELALAAQDEIIELLAKARDRARSVTLADLEARFAARERELRIRQLEQESQGRELELQKARAAAAEDAIKRQRERWALLSAGLAVLVLALSSALLYQRWRAQHRRAELLRRESLHDALTGLENRRAFFRRLEAALARGLAARGDVLMIIDLDHFKQLNDRGGHLFGDQVLVEVAECLWRTLTGRADVARLGGEEFAVLAVGLAAGDATRLAEQMRTAVDALRFRLGAEELRVTISIGIAVFDGEHCRDIATWMRAADEALYAAKAHGRNRVVSAALVQQA